MPIYYWRVWSHEFNLLLCLESLLALLPSIMGWLDKRLLLRQGLLHLWLPIQNCNNKLFFLSVLNQCYNQGYVVLLKQHTDLGQWDCKGRGDHACHNQGWEFTLKSRKWFINGTLECIPSSAIPLSLWRRLQGKKEDRERRWPQIWSFCFHCAPQLLHFREAWKSFTMDLGSSWSWVKLTA